MRFFKKVPFSKISEKCFLRKYKKFFNLRTRKFHFPKYKKNFFGERIRIFFYFSN